MHYAWVIPQTTYWSSSENVQWEDAGYQLLSAFVRHGGQRAVMAGSCAEYEWKYWHLSEYVMPTREPYTIYGCEESYLARRNGLRFA